MKRSSTSIVTLGFLLMGAMILALSGTALFNMRAAQDHIESIVGVNNVKVALVTQMRNAARDRALILHRITLMDDPFEIDEETQKYSESAVAFREALDTFRAMQLDATEQKVLHDALARVRIGQASQDRVMALFLAEQRAAANRLLLKETLPAQQSVFDQLDTLLKLQRDSTDVAFAETAESYRVAYSVTSTLVAAVIVLGILIGLFVIRRSASIEHELFQEKEFAEVTLQSIADGVITTDKQGRVNFINASAAGMVGMQGRDILGLPVLTALGIDPGATAPSFADILGASHVKPYQQRLTVGSNDEARTLEWSLSPMRDEGEHVTGSVLVLHDISSTLRSAEQLRLLNATLEEKVVDRTLALSAANQELKQTIATLQETQGQLVQSEKMASLGSLVAGISHEINTPLGISVTSASSLQVETAELTAHFTDGSMKRSDLQTFLGHANQACNILLTNMERASNLIRSFKQVAVDQSTDDWRQLNLHDYIEEILTSLRPRLKHAAVIVENQVDQALSCYTHPGAIYQIISNLVLNALIHAYEPEQAGTIRIDARREGGSIVLTCQDDGKGIPQDNLSRIFEPFFTTRRGAGGTGLGLNIVYNIVTTQLHGDIGVTSALQQGTRFTVRFPDPSQQAAG